MKGKRSLWIAGIIILVYLVALFSSFNDDPPKEEELNDGEVIESVSDNSYNLDLLQGEWWSLDDTNSTIVFDGNKKIDYYFATKMSEGDFEVVDDHLTVGAGDDVFEYQIVSLSDNLLTLTYLPRGNTLKYQRKL
jgi:hypothetical protein